MILLFAKILHRCSDSLYITLVPQRVGLRPYCEAIALLRITLKGSGCALTTKQLPSFGGLP
jgi:hypothetical protein